MKQPNRFWILNLIFIISLSCAVLGQTTQRTIESITVKTWYGSQSVFRYDASSHLWSNGQNSYTTSEFIDYVDSPALRAEITYSDRSQITEYDLELNMFQDTDTISYAALSTDSSHYVWVGSGDETRQVLVPSDIYNAAKTAANGDTDRQNLLLSIWAGETGGSYTADGQLEPFSRYGLEQSYASTYTGTGKWDDGLAEIFVPESYELSSFGDYQQQVLNFQEYWVQTKGETITESQAIVKLQDSETAASAAMWQLNQVIGNLQARYEANDREFNLNDPEVISAIATDWNSGSGTAQKASNQLIVQGVATILDLDLSDIRSTTDPEIGFSVDGSYGSATDQAIAMVYNQIVSGSITETDVSADRSTYLNAIRDYYEDNINEDSPLVAKVDDIPGPDSSDYAYAVNRAFEALSPLEDQEYQEPYNEYGDMIPTQPTGSQQVFQNDGEYYVIKELNQNGAESVTNSNGLASGYYVSEADLNDEDVSNDNNLYDSEGNVVGTYDRTTNTARVSNTQTESSTVGSVIAAPFRWYGSGVVQGYRQFMAETSFKTNDQLAAQWQTDGAYQASMLLLNELLGEWAYGQISAYCESEWESSESASGDTATQTLNEEIPEVEENQTNETNATVNYCSGYDNETIGTAQLSIVDEGEWYENSYSWTLLACKQDITYSVYLNDGGYPRANGMQYYNQPASAETDNFDSTILYHEICIQTNDMDFGEDGIECFAGPSINETSNGTNFNDQCPVLGTFSHNATKGIYFAGVGYSASSGYSSIVSSYASSMLDIDAISNYYTSGMLNFYQINDLRATYSSSVISSAINNYCNYTDQIETKLIIVLSDEFNGCTQTGITVKLNPAAEFNYSETDGETLSEILSNFCAYVTNLGLANPPVVTLDAMNTTIAPGEISISFVISDEETPVYYDVIWNNNTLYSSSATTGSTVTRTINAVETGTLRIKAIDKRGSSSYSDEVLITVTDQLFVNFSSLSPLTITQGGSATISLNNYVEDPTGATPVEWAHEPGFSNCFTFSPETRITDGSVTITHASSSSCSESFVFTAIAADNRRGSDTIIIQTS